MLKKKPANFVVPFGFFLVLSAYPWAGTGFFILLLPVWVGFILERNPAKPHSKAMLFWGATALIPAAVRFFSADTPVDKAVAFHLTAPLFILTWILCGIGYFSVEIAPTVVKAVMGFIYRSENERLSKEKKAILEEWEIKEKINKQP